MKVKGWKQVFAFTFMQQIKTKSFIVGTIIISLLVAVIAFTADFLPAVLMADKFNEANSSEANFLGIEELYINQTGYEAIDFSDISNAYPIKIHDVSTEEADAKIKEIENTAVKTVVSKISRGETGFVIQSSYSGGESGVSESTCGAVNVMLSSMLRSKYLQRLGVPAEEITTVISDIRTSSARAGEAPVSMVQGLINSVVPMISSIVLFIFIFSYSQMVAQSVAIEKSSRIVEYLLTSIKPLALIVGKVLAMCAVSLMQFFIIVISGSIGFVISIPFGIFTKVGQLSSQAAATSAGMEITGILDDIRSAFANVDITVFIIMIVTFILGFLLFAGLAGLAGSSISKMEDLAPALQPISIIGVIGFYFAYFPQISGEENTMSILSRYLPISSPFILPSDYMLSRIDMTEAIISIVILAVFDVLLVMLVAKVYENIILHTGNRLKLGDMLKMSK